MANTKKTKTSTAKAAESKVQEVAASLFEGNLGKSQEQEMKEDPKKKKGLGRRR